MISDKYVERVNFHYLENDELAITLCLNIQKILKMAIYSGFTH